MSKRMFTKGQIMELLKNENVSKCSEKSITYTKNFKHNVLTLYEQGQTATEIFRQAGFNLDVVSKEQPDECLRRWKIIFKRKGIEGLSEVRGQNGIKGNPTKDLSDKAKIEYLEAQVAYLKAENDFLAKLRAKRRE
jgi:transposase